MDVVIDNCRVAIIGNSKKVIPEVSMFVNQIDRVCSVMPASQPAEMV